jgi:hypothetical protein
MYWPTDERGSLKEPRAFTTQEWDTLYLNSEKQVFPDQTIIVEAENFVEGCMEYAICRSLFNHAVRVGWESAERAMLSAVMEGLAGVQKQIEQEEQSAEPADETEPSQAVQDEQEPVQGRDPGSEGAGGEARPLDPSDQGIPQLDRVDMGSVKTRLMRFLWRISHPLGKPD